MTNKPELPASDSNASGTLVYKTINIGEQLGHLEFSVSSEMLREYGSAVEYSESGYVNLAIREFYQVLTNKYGPMDLSSCCRNDYYYRPPIVDRRIQVSGWIRDKYLYAGVEYLVVGTLAIDDIGIAPMSENYTKAYLHHLFKTEEILGYRIATQQNLHFYIHLMKTMQDEIKAGNFKNWAKGFLERYEGE